MDQRPAVLFGPFQLDLAGRRLTEAGRPVVLGGRALELLIALVERPGELVTKAELTARVWPDTNVGEANLGVQISAIRRALGDKMGATCIAAVSGRGYRFVAPLEPETNDWIPFEHRLPASLTETIGRDTDVAALSERLNSARLLTIVGPGGIGKTTLALACARALKDKFADGAVFVEMTSGGDLAVAVAAALGLRFAGLSVIDALTSFLAPLELLIVLDCCEYAIEPSARLAETILKRSPDTTVLCTSREPLRAEGEAVWQIQPLATPAEDERLSAESALNYAAVRLFVERASAADHRFSLTNADVAAVCSICRRLDGLPLAIELAAGRIAALGLGGLAATLDNRFQLLVQGRRTAPPRHQTLAAAIDWSYDSLSEDEQQALRRFCLFHGPFDADAAAHLALGPDAGAGSIYGVLSSLVAKSLVTADLGRSPTEYRLLDSTRDYARLKLETAGELNSIAARHAARTFEIFKSAESDLEARSMEDWLNRFNRRLEDARFALDWAYAPGGDRSYAAPLVLAAIPVWMHLGRFEECWRWIEVAKDAVERGSADELALNIALGHVAVAGGDKGRRAGEAASERALLLARARCDAASEFRATWATLNIHMAFSRISPAREAAVRLSELVAQGAGPFEELIARRATAQTEVLVGNLAAARAANDSVLTISRSRHARELLKWYAYDPYTMARKTLVSLLWLEGKPDTAIAIAHETASQALQAGNDNLIPAVLADAACGMALRVGDEDAAERYLALLDASLRRGAPAMYGTFAAIARAGLAARRGDVEPGLAVLRAGLDIASLHPRFPIVLTELAESLASAGAIEQARGLADDLLERISRTGEGWILSEVQRIRAELCDDGEEARRLLEFALETAAVQGAKVWELRAATSLARRWPRTATEVLSPLVESFSEGRGTRDLVEARQALTAR